MGNAMRGGIAMPRTHCECGKEIPQPTKEEEFERALELSREVGSQDVIEPGSKEATELRELL